jgi:hypothetical protein
MALLRAKRSRAKENHQKTVTFLLQDNASVEDMVRYFEGVGYTVQVLQHTHYEISVYRENMNARNG